MKPTPLAGLSIVAAAMLLSGCNTSETLDPEGARSAPPTTIVGTETATLPSGNIEVAIAPQGDGGSGTAAANAMARVQLAPAVGATLEAATPLSERLESRGREKRIDFRGEGASGIGYVMKGYFSASREPDGTIVYYVWDVLDPLGNRLHRIFGQETTRSGAGTDAWSDVTPQTMQAIADNTVDQLATWLAARGG
ncbi:MAG: hypothetical protein K5872_20280 [Rhizobiaceae bacterium]|nr:hypothetical protein [Rhizobiaceae bacterium]MCV0408557.1 hypothetical protein [Rhizobiaceae bacterium]